MSEYTSFLIKEEEYKIQDTRYKDVVSKDTTKKYGDTKDQKLGFAPETLNKRPLPLWHLIFERNTHVGPTWVFRRMVRDHLVSQIQLAT